VVHTDMIIDTRTQKWLATQKRITESVLPHDQHWEEQNTLTAFLTFCMLGLYTFHIHFFY